MTIECHARIVRLMSGPHMLGFPRAIRECGLQTSRTPSETPSESRPRAARRRPPTALRPCARDRVRAAIP